MTTDGDTKAAIERVRRSLVLRRGWPDASSSREALDLITARLSEQEAELERLRLFERFWFALGESSEATEAAQQAILARAALTLEEGT